jgi:hypothetical protein
VAAVAAVAVGPTHPHVLEQSTCVQEEEEEGSKKAFQYWDLSHSVVLGFACCSQCVTLKADGEAEWELGGNRVVQVSIPNIPQQELQLDCRGCNSTMPSTTFQLAGISQTAAVKQQHDCSDKPVIDALLQNAMGLLLVPPPQQMNMHGRTLLC